MKNSTIFVNPELPRAMVVFISFSDLGVFLGPLIETAGMLNLVHKTC